MNAERVRIVAEDHLGVLSRLRRSPGTSREARRTAFTVRRTAALAKTHLLLIRRPRPAGNEWSR
jgi:hypothetical protein